MKLKQITLIRLKAIGDEFKTLLRTIYGGHSIVGNIDEILAELVARIACADEDISFINFVVEILNHFNDGKYNE
jgi:hypothetical protein